MGNALTLTIAEYHAGSDEFTVRFSDTRPDEFITGEHLHRLWCVSHENPAANSDVDNALAAIYDIHYADEPSDILNKSITF